MINNLLDMDGVTGVHASIELRVDIRCGTTDEVDDQFNQVRERDVTEEQLEQLVDGTNWEYLGTIDAPNEFYVTDKMVQAGSFKEDEV